jgi:SAM-dependent methyltransferase
MVMTGRSFDSAAETFDQTRGFPPGVGELVARAALEWIGGRRQVVDVGIGTGRIAKPLMACGAAVTGVDLSRHMLQHLRQALPPPSAPPDLVQADATRLPLADGSFDAVISVHVFQLLGDWLSALAEVRRVLRTGGVFLNGFEWRPPDSPGARLLERWQAIIQANSGSTNQPVARDFADIKIDVLDTGAACEERTIGEWTTTRTLARQVETIEHRTWSVGWAMPEEFFSRSLAQLRSWAVNEYGALDRVYTVRHRFIWQRFAWD